jgi:hypothetical protein
MGWIELARDLVDKRRGTGTNPQACMKKISSHSRALAWAINSYSILYTASPYYIKTKICHTHVHW